MSYSAELVAIPSLEYFVESTPSLATAASTTTEFSETVEDIVLITSNSSNEVNASDGFLPPTVEFYRHSLAVSAVYCFAYTLVFILGICGNSFVVAVVFRSPRMRTVTNIFIVNLALADILVLIFCLPATLLGNIFVPWILGWFMCKTVPYLQGVSVSASINTLVAISLDRFLAICCPLKCQLSTRVARRIIIVIWVLSLSITLPWALYFQLTAAPDRPDMLFCMEIWPHKDSGTLYFLAANMGLCYLFPLCIITACYVCIWIRVWRRNIPGETKGTNADVLMQRSKLKVVKMMLVVVILFVISWLPLYIIFTRLKLGPPIDPESQEHKIVLIMTPIAQWLGASNSCINPVLYAFFNKKFRRGFLAIIKSRRCCGTLRYDPGKRRNSNMLRSTLRSRYDTQCDYVSTANV